MGTLQAHFTVLVVASALLDVALGRLCDSDPGSGNFLILNRQYWVDWLVRENCTEVPGGLLLSGDVTDLSPLRNLTRIGQSDGGWSLVIYKALEVESLSGLSGWELTSMPGGILVQECPRLRSLQGLEGIRSAGALRIEQLPWLQSLEGLEGLEGLSGAGSVVLHRLDQLSDLAGLRGLKGVLAGGISIKQCRTLSSLAGLEAVTGLGGILVRDCPALQSLEGLEGVSLASFVTLFELPDLQDLAGLRGLGATNSLTVSACPSLVSLEGLGGLTGGVDRVQLLECPLLQSLRGLEGVSSAGSISLWKLPQVRDLSGLGGPQGITLSGGLSIVECSGLASLTGLESMSTAGSITMFYLPQLRNLSGLRGLHGNTLPGGLTVGECSGLASLTGLEGVSSAGSISLWRLPQLRDLSGLGGLQNDTLPGGLTIRDCSGLASLTGLEGVSSAGSVSFWMLPQLRDLSGLGGLRGDTLPSGLSLQDCSGLVSLAGLESVTGLGASAAGWSLSFIRLPNLTSLAPLRGVRGHMPGGLQLADCQALSSLHGLEQVVSFNGSNTGGALSLTLLNITSLDGLRGLRGSLGGGIEIIACPWLQTLEGLEGVTMLGRSATGTSLDLSELRSLTSLRGLRGLVGTLPGSLRISNADALRDLEGLQGVSALCGDGPPPADSLARGAAISLRHCPSLQSILGLRGLQASLRGDLLLDGLSELLRLGGLEGLTTIEAAPQAAVGDGLVSAGVTIRCWALESLDGISGLQGPLNGLTVLSGHLQSLEAFAENISVSSGHFILSTGGPICGRAEVLEQLGTVEVQGSGVRVLDVPDEGQAPHCRSCPQPCRAYRGRRVTCDVIRGGCRCPLGRTGPDCLKAPELDVALPPKEQDRALQIHRPPPGARGARSMDLCVPLRRSAPTNGSAAVRLRELRTGDTCPGRDAGYALLPPFNDVTWSSEDPTQGCLIAHLEVGRGPNRSSPVLRLVLAYESPSGGRYPDHLINGTLRETGDPWDHPWPDCLHIDTCWEQQERVALAVHFLEQQDCPENMELDYGSCTATQCPDSGMSPGIDAAGGSVPTGPAVGLQEACECRQGHALMGRCVARPGYWALNSTFAVPCPFSADGNSTCLGRNRCAPGFKGVMCAACPEGQVQHSGGCSTCSSGQGVLCVIVAVVSLAAAGLLPHLLGSARLRSCVWKLLQAGSKCLGQGGQVRQGRIWTRLRITYLKLQELLVWSWGFLLLFPEVGQQLGGFRPVAFLASAFNALAFPELLQCSCGVDVFGEFGILMLAPSTFALVTSVSACWGAWRGMPDLAATWRRGCCRLRCPGRALRCHQLWQERRGPQLLFCALHFTFSPLMTLLIIYAPFPGVGFHCVGAGGERECFFRRDYRLRLDSADYSSFQTWWLLSCLWQLSAPLVLLLILCRPQTNPGAEGVLALFCSEFKRGRASFEVANLLRQTLLAGAVLLSPGGSLPQLYWSCLISGAYLALLHLVEPYRNRGDQTLQSLNTIGGMVLFGTLIVELALVGAPQAFFDSARESWLRPLLEWTVSAVLLWVTVAPFIEPILGPALRRFVVWLDGLKPGARGNNASLLDPRCKYKCLVLEEKSTVRDEADTRSLCETLLQGMERVEREGTQPQAISPQLQEDVRCAREFRLEEFIVPGDPKDHKKQWMHVYPGSAMLTQAKVRELLTALTNILVENVGRRTRRPEVRINAGRTDLTPFMGRAYHKFMLVREEPPISEQEPSTAQVLAMGIACLGKDLKVLGGTQQGRILEQSSQDIQTLERLEDYEVLELRDVPELQPAGFLGGRPERRHAVVRAKVDRSLDHKEAAELPELLRRPFERACLLLNIPLNDAQSFRIVTRFTGPPIQYPQLLQLQQAAATVQPQQTAAAPNPRSQQNPVAAATVQPQVPAAAGNPQASALAGAPGATAAAAASALQPEHVVVSL